MEKSVQSWPIQTCWNEDTPPPDTRIFSPRAVAGLCVTIGHQVNEFNCFQSLRSHSIFPITADGNRWFIQNTFKETSYFEVHLLFLRQWKVYVLPRFRHKTSTAGISLRLAGGCRY